MSRALKLHALSKPLKGVSPKNSSFTSHLTKKHKTLLANLLSDSAFEREQAAVQDSRVTIGDTDISFISDSHDFDSVLDEDVIQNVDEDQYLHSLSFFYLKLQAKFSLPASTIQSVIVSFQEIYDIGQSHLFSRHHEKLSLLNISDADARNLIEELSKADVLKACNSGVLRTDQTRKTFSKCHFNVTEPISLYLWQDGNRERRDICIMSPSKKLCKLLSDMNRSETSTI